MPDVFRRVSRMAVRAVLFVMLLTPTGPAQILAGESTSISAATEVLPTESLTLQEAIARALLHNPELEIYSEELSAREAEALQAGLRSNPHLGFEAENVFGSGHFSGTGAAETTLSINQTLELGGKRSHRRTVAEAQTQIAQSELLLARSDLIARTAEAFFAVLAAQERLELAEELLELARRVRETVEDRIAAGRAAQAEGVRPRIRLREQEIALGRAHSELAVARNALAAMIGLDQHNFGPASGDLSQLPELPDRVELERELAGSPQITRRLAESERSRRAVGLEESRRIVDLELSVGARYLRDVEDTALVLGISAPLPLFDRNQGAIAAARSRQARARAEERSAYLQTQVALSAAWQQMSTARTEAVVLRDDIIPAALHSLESIEYGYGAGRFGILDVLDAQQTLIEVRERYLDVLLAFHRFGAELERLLGISLFPAVHTSDPLSSRSDSP